MSHSVKTFPGQAMARSDGISAHALYRRHATNERRSDPRDRLLHLACLYDNSFENTAQESVFQRSRIRSKKSGAGASRIRSRSCYRIQELLIPHYIGSFCLTGAPVKPISSVLQDLLSIKTCSNRSTCDKRSTCNSRRNSNTRSFCNNINAELSCF